MTRRALRIHVSDRAGEVSALLLRPKGAKALLALAHGAGADMHHRFMEAIAEALAGQGMATFRYQFPYTEAGKRRPDHRNLLIATVRAAIQEATKQARGLALYAGGKSMGGRMTSLAAAEEPLPGVRGLVFFGFPMHPAGKPGVERAEHLKEVELPMLFLQGEKDRLAELALLEPLVEELGRPATLLVVPDGDHSFHVPKRTGHTDEEIIVELAGWAESWVDRHLRRA